MTASGPLEVDGDDLALVVCAASAFALGLTINPAQTPAGQAALAAAIQRCGAAVGLTFDPSESRN